MRRYETIVILDPDLSKEAEGPFFDRVTDLIPQYKGELIETDDWGIRKLAYDIKKKNRGHYVRFDFCGDGALVDEMERAFRIDDRVMKYMTVLLDAEADPEAIKAEMDANTATEDEPADEGAETETPATTTEATATESEPTEEKKEE